nr:uncharacterized protein LOC111413393 [Onthophagus taurus]
MSDYQWDALAEVYLSNKDADTDIYCLCSRVFIRSRDDKIKLNANLTDEFSVSETEVLTEDDIKDGCMTEIEPEQCQSQESSTDPKHEIDAEIVSCYCSASHTDNISTDEHDSLRESHSSTTTNNKSHIIRGLQSSDSGADLTEYNIKTIDYDSAWHRYWTLNGERIIWDSWIAKYSDYINPEFLPTREDIKVYDKVLIDSSNSKDHSKTKFSFDKKDLEKYGIETITEYVSHLDRIDENVEVKDYKSQDNSTHVSCMLVRTLSGSDSYDKLQTEVSVSEGWNPLSPISIECDAEAERLLSSRCGSYASSSARTVDSMTNVTRMTVSSFELSDNSSKTSDSFSSVSSVQSSFSSTSSEEADPGDPNDYKQQWDALWKRHYEEEYMQEFKRFISIISDHPDKDNKFGNKKSYFEKTVKVENKDKNKDSCSSVDGLFHTLSIKMSDSDIVIESIDDHVEEQDLMKSIGLPTSFGRRGRKRIALKEQDNQKVETEEEEPSNSDHIKSAFNLMGLEFKEDLNKRSKLKGHVEYKMKHIRLQNRHLKLHRQNHHNHRVKKPNHIRFDDDGNIIPEDNDKDELGVSDSSDDQQSTSSDNDEDQNKMQTFPLEDLEKSETVTIRKKKRKRKINLPPEIRENPNLKKYWSRRFSLFHKFDEGIKLDEESWYSVTPEQIARHTAQRLKCDIIIDAFCGAGGNAIQFALTCNKVIAIDIDSNKIELARNNAEIYGVSNKIEFIVGNFLDLAAGLKGDVVFLSPPWGGPSYLKQPTYELEEFLQPVPLSKLIETSRIVTENIALFLPRNSNTYALTMAAGPSGFVEVEQNFINKKFVAITAYYKDLIKHI